PGCPAPGAAGPGRRSQGPPRRADPLGWPQLFRAPAFAAASGAVALSNLAMYSPLLAVPQLLSQRVGWTSVAIGGVVAALPVGTMATAPLGGWLADRCGRRWPAALGLSVLTIAAIPLAVDVEGLGLLGLSGSLALAGAGLGMSSAPLQAAAVETVEVDAAGIAAGVFATSSYVCSIVGSMALAS